MISNFAKKLLRLNFLKQKERSAERAQVWEGIANKLEKMEHPKFKVEQRSVRDRFKKIIKQFREKENNERRASGISPELTELDTLLEEINEKEEASETLAAVVEMEKRRLEEDQMAGEEIRKRAMETLSQTQQRNSKKDQNCPKRKVRKGGDTALAFLAEKERKLKEESNRLERERLEYEKEKTEKFMQQQSEMLAAMLEMRRQQNNQVQASQMILLQQQQQGQSLIALLSKIVDKES